MNITGLDHLVLTVADVDATCAFYERVCGMKVVEFGGGRKALHFGVQKINLHQAGAEFEPKADKPTPGSGDICLLSKGAMEDVIAHLKGASVEIEDGPVARTAAAGPIVSVYFRDPDGNLVEIGVLD